MYIKKIKKLLEGNNNPIKYLADLSNIFQSIAAIFTVAGIVFAYFEYQTQQTNIRQEKAFDLYQQFNQEYFIESRNDLELVVSEKIDKLYPDAEHYIKTMIPIWQKQSANIINITKFFEQVATCVNDQLCDEEATRVFFRREANDFFQTHYQFFCWKRLDYGSENTGIILEEFLKKPGAKDYSCDHMYKFLKEVYETINPEEKEQELEVTANNIKKLEDA